MLWFVESSLEMDAFELLDSYANKLAIVRPHNLVVNKLKRSIFVRGSAASSNVVDEE